VPTYSTNFWTGPVPAGSTVLYTVPALEVVVIRDIEAFNSASSAQQISVQSRVSGSTGIIFNEAAAVSAANFQWQGRVVIPAGGELLGYAAEAGLLLIVSGYLLGS
jgi:hypothetical protein